MEPNRSLFTKKNLELFKSVILRTKSFKAFILIILLISCIFLQNNNTPYTIEDQQINTYNNLRRSNISESKEIQLANIQNEIEDLRKEIVEQVVEKQIMEKAQNGTVSPKIKGIQSVVKQSVKFLDIFMDQESENYQVVKSMIDLWNPESSKWAVQASKKYRYVLSLRLHYARA